MRYTTMDTTMDTPLTKSSEYGNVRRRFKKELINETFPKTEVLENPQI